MRLYVCLALLSACGGSKASFPPPANGVQLKSDPYTLQPQDEKYYCYTKTVDHDVAATEIDVDAGTLVHHLAVFYTIAPEPDGFSECPSLIKQTWIPLYGGGRNTPGMTLPEGAGFKFKAGQQILMQLHLLNAEPHAVTETTAVNLIFAADPAPLTPAGIFAVGKLRFSIPAGAMAYPITSQCAAPKALDVFAAFPHMHKLGRTIQLDHGASQETASPLVQIDPWSFGDQPMKMMSLHVNQGDYLKATCTYDNTTDHTVGYGESSNDEMCFVVLFYTPFDGLGGCVE
jgi:hypothetical protein